MWLGVKVGVNVGVIVGVNVGVPVEGGVGVKVGVGGRAARVILTGAVRQQVGIAAAKRTKNITGQAGCDCAGPIIWDGDRVAAIRSAGHVLRPVVDISQGGSAYPAAFPEIVKVNAGVTMTLAGKG